LTSGSASAFNQANQQTGNVATSSTSGQTASEAANAPPPQPFLPPSHIQSGQQNNFQQAAAPSNNISQYSTNPCTGIASCAGCVQQSLQSQAYCQQQPQSAEVAQQAATATAMEMTAILHSQPPLQLVSCHGPIMSQSTPLNQRSYQHPQVPIQMSAATASTASNQQQQNDIPDYCNLPQPRQQSSIASAAAAVAAASTSFNSKRSRHSSLWSLQDDPEEGQDQVYHTSDMVNYVNDPFGASCTGGSSGGTGGTNSTAEFGASSYRVDQNSHEVVSSLEQSRISAAASHMDAFRKGSRYSASNEALN